MGGVEFIDSTECRVDSPRNPANARLLPQQQACKSPDNQIDRMIQGELVCCPSKTRSNYCFNTHTLFFCLQQIFVKNILCKMKENQQKRKSKVLADMHQMLFTAGIQGCLLHLSFRSLIFSFPYLIVKTFFTKQIQQASKKRVW